MRLLTNWGYTLTDVNVIPDMMEDWEYSQFTGRNDDPIRVSAELSAACAAIQNYVGWHLYPSLSCSFETIIRDRRIIRTGRDMIIQLPARYVTDISSVTIGGKTYEDYKTTVTNKVEEDINRIKERLNIDFDDHVLHEKLIEPTKDICLSTNISREDTLVMVSCMFPKPLERLDFGVILSNDKQYKDAFENSKSTIENTLKNKGITIPSFLSIKQLQYEDGNIINLNVQNTNVEITTLWNWIIRQMIIKKHRDTFVGETLVPMKKLIGCIAFSNKTADSILYDSDGLIFIPDDLSRTIIIEKNTNYWNGGIEITELPYINTADIEYNLEVSCSESDMKVLCKKGNLVFYYNL